MTLSQIEQQREPATLVQGYTHKKFNYGYSHKKLGLRLRQREPNNNEETSTQTQMGQVKTIKSSKDLFRPYALDESNTPRKCKLPRTLKTLEQDYSTAVSLPQDPLEAYSLQINQQLQQTRLNFDTTIACPTTATYNQSHDSGALSPSSYNMILQKQRAAPYMHYMAEVQQHQPTVTRYPMGYPNVTAPMFTGYWSLE